MGGKCPLLFIKLHFDLNVLRDLVRSITSFPLFQSKGTFCQSVMAEYMNECMFRVVSETE
jgi:hypothetical protein